jgi:hypothetical protein
MSAEPRRRLLLVATGIAAAALAAWLWLRQERAAVPPASVQPGVPAAVPPASAPASGPASVTPSAGAPAPEGSGAGGAPDPSAPPEPGSSEPTAPAMSVDERQDAKIARGLTGAAEGGLVVESAPPASVVGALRLQPGDVILTVNGASVATPADFVRLYREQGMPSELTILRAGREMHLHSANGAP